MSEPTNVSKRMPEWIEDDNTIGGVSDEVEVIKLRGWINILSRRTQQPIQIWREHQTTTPKIYSELSDSNVIQITVVNDGYLPVNPRIIFEPKCCFFDYEGNLTISDGTNILVYTGEFCGPLDFKPEGVVMHERFDHTGRVTGVFPVIPPRSSRTITVTVDQLPLDTSHEVTIMFDEFTDYKICARLLTKKLRPLREFTIYNADGDIPVGAKEFSEFNEVKSAYYEVEHQNMEKFYIEVGYYGIEKTAFRGFPVDPESLDPTYLPNSELDYKATENQLFRRVYRDDIEPWEYGNTFPVGYPYPIEQDYWLEKRILEEYTEVFPTYGLLKSEIHSYLGVIPTLRSMIENVLIWDEGNWDEKVWGGDDYDQGVFQVEIPIEDIPSNFRLLSIEELLRIINRCKILGTKGIPVYVYDAPVLNLGLKTTVDSGIREYCATLQLGLRMDLGDTYYAKLGLGLKNSVAIQDATPNMNENIGFGLSCEAFQRKLTRAFTSDTDFSTCFLKNINIVGSGSGAYIQLKNNGSLYYSYGYLVTPPLEVAVDQNLWESIESTAPTLPASASVHFDAFKEDVDQSQLSKEAAIPIGKDYDDFYQIVDPSVIEVSGIELEAASNVGSPTDNVIVSIEGVNSSDQLNGMVYATYTITSWSGVMNIPIYSDALPSSGRVAIVLRRTGTKSSVNYRNVKATNNTSLYPFPAFYKTGYTYSDVNKVLCFKLLTPNYLLRGGTLPTGLDGITNDDIKLKCRFNTLDQTVTPVLNDITIRYLKRVHGGT